MQFSVSSKPLAQIKTDCLVIILGKNGSFLPTTLPEPTQALIHSKVKSGDFGAAKTGSLLLHEPVGINAKRLLLIGTGSDHTITSLAWSGLVRQAASAAARTGARSAALHVDIDLVAPADNAIAAELISAGIRAIADSHYRFDLYRSQKQTQSTLKSWQLLSTGKPAQLQRALTEGQAMAVGISMAKDLGNQPPNICHPQYLVSEARKLANQYDKLKVTVLSEKQAEKLGMGAFCSVARGSEQGGQIIAFEYQGASGKPVALVGKGITFDTGGISLKPGASMDEMKYDMCGAASVFGTVKAICELDLPIHLVAVVAAAENMPDGRASRPGDIVTSLSGQTIEILNTDAEGRLVLCDALTWVQQKFKPHTVIDIATLTGACVVALGSHAQAVYANDDQLSQALLDAGKHAGDRGWPMPLWDEYQPQLDSPFADMANIGGPKAGSITAACFLSRFTKKVKWAHLDIAGTAWVSGGKDKGATGRPVAMLTRFLMAAAKK